MGLGNICAARVQLKYTCTLSLAMAAAAYRAVTIVPTYYDRVDSKDDAVAWVRKVLHLNII